MARDNQESSNERIVHRKEGEMTVAEAGHLGGEKGGQRVAELIEKGKEAEGRESGNQGGNSGR